VPGPQREGDARRAREVRYARRRLLESGLERVNLLIEVADARAPRATRSPVLGSGRFAAKARVLVLCRADLADRTVTAAWLAQLGEAAVAVDARSGRGIERLLAAMRRVRPTGEVRAMVVGLPNLGKSSLVNRLAGGARAATGNRPGVTVGEQWIRARTWLRLVDEPGVLPGGADDPLLAALGCVPDGAYDALSAFTAVWRLAAVRQALARRVPGVGTDASTEAAAEALARATGALAAGGRPDAERGARVALALLRDGRLGPLSLERPDDDGETAGDVHGGAAVEASRDANAGRDAARPRASEPLAP
jgi:ribosome biogenesis GTPase A